MPKPLTEDEAWELIAEKIDEVNWSSGLCVNIADLFISGLIDWPLGIAMRGRVRAHMEVDGRGDAMLAFDWKDYDVRILAALLMAEEVRSEIENGIYIQPRSTSRPPTSGAGLFSF